MIERVASLPMYDADRAAVEAWWLAIARTLRESGLVGVPVELRWPVDLQAHWQDPGLLLSQMCGYPLVTGFAGKVQVVGAFRYTAPGCDGIFYRSALLARTGDGPTIEDFRGRTAAVNSRDSHSGSNALRGVVAPLATDGAFFGSELVTGSHRASLLALHAGAADLAAIDCVTLAGIVRREPEAMAGLHIIGATPGAPGLPLVTASGTSGEDMGRLREALVTACSDPSYALVRDALFIGGFEVAEATDWQAIDDTRRLADTALWRADTA